MVDPVETAHEQIHEAHHAHGDADPWPRRMAVVVSVLAASLALSEIGAKSTQTAYLTHHIAASDTWNFYQAKNLRATLRNSQAVMLRSLPNAESPAIQERIATALAEESRMRDEPGKDGMKQLKAHAEDLEHERDHAFHLYHGYEYTTGALEIDGTATAGSIGGVGGDGALGTTGSKRSAAPLTIERATATAHA